MYANGMVGKYFFNHETVRGVDCHQMLESYFQSEAEQVQQNAVLQKDGSPLEIIRPTVPFLNKMGPDLWTAGYIPTVWPTNPPSLAPLDFFLPRFLNSKVYWTSVPSLMQLKQTI